MENRKLNVRAFSAFLLVALLLIIIAAITSGHDSTNSDAAVAGQSPATVEPTDVTSSSDDASNVYVCGEFVRTVADFTMTDEQSATAFGALAGQASDPELAAALQEIADKFAAHSPAVSSVRVQAACATR